MPEFGDPEFLTRETTMNTTIQPSIDSPIRIRSGPGLIDRAALRLGSALTEWAEHAESRRTERIARRRLRSEHAQELIRWRAEREREQAGIDSSLLFRNLQ